MFLLVSLPNVSSITIDFLFDDISVNANLLLAIIINSCFTIIYYFIYLLKVQ